MGKKLYGDLTGNKYGKLTVIRRAEDTQSKSGKSNVINWVCKCDCGNEITIKQTTLLSKTKKVKSCGCVNTKIPRERKNQMSAEEIADWNNLYDYVCMKVMGFPKNTLTGNMIFRLKGMAQGKKIANHNSHNNEIIYPYNVILNTFKFCMPEIKKVIDTKEFYTDDLKFRYICTIVESKLNTVYKRMKNAEINKKYIESIEVPSVVEIKTENWGKRKEEKPSKNKFDYLW